MLYNKSLKRYKKRSRKAKIKRNEETSDVNLNQASNQTSFTSQTTDNRVELVQWQITSPKQTNTNNQTTCGILPAILTSTVSRKLESVDSYVIKNYFRLR